VHQVRRGSRFARLRSFTISQFSVGVGSRQQLRPLEVQRAQVERYVWWMQEVRRFKPSTVSRRIAVVAGFYRTCVIDAVLEHSPADYVRRPPVPAESPTLGLSPLQFEALLTAARNSTNVSNNKTKRGSSSASRNSVRPCSPTNRPNNCGPRAPTASSSSMSPDSTPRRRPSQPHSLDTQAGDTGPP
jgi:hypothetical protein